MNTIIAEFSRLVLVDALPERGRDFVIEATAAEREALASRLGVVAIDSLTAEGRLTPGNRGRDVSVQGHLTADIRERCVVTLDIFTTHLEGEVQSRFSADVDDEWITAIDEGGERLADREAEAFIEPLTDGVIDIGEVVVQHLSLDITPYPRKPLQSNDRDHQANVLVHDESRPSPFSILGDLPLMRDKRQH